LKEMQLQLSAELNISDIRELMESYGEDIWNYAYVITRNTHTADDVGQDVFIKAYEHSFRGEASMETWLLKITRNAVLSYLKRAFFRRVVLLGEQSPGDGLEGMAGNSSSPSAEAEYSERHSKRYTPNIAY